MLNNPRMAAAPRPGGAGPRPRARVLGRRLRPDPRRPDPPAAVRRPLLPAPRPRRRPDRARDDPDAPGPGGRGRDHGLHGVHDHPPPDRGRDRVRGAFGYWRTTGEPVVFPAKAIVLATGGIGRAYEVTSNSWEYSGDGQALAYLAGAELIDMEFVQFHPTGMVWPPGVRGLLVTEAVRGEGGILRNKDGERFMWKYLPEDRRHEYAATDEEATTLGRGAERRPDDRRPAAARAVDPRQRRPGDLHRGPRGPRLAPRRRVPRHQLPAARTTSGASCPRCTSSSRSSPTSTSRPARWRSGPTTHYMMGGIRVDAETGATTRPGPVRRGRGRGRDARREPARRQLALGPARVRPADRRRRRGVRGDARATSRTLDPAAVQSARARAGRAVRRG